MKIFFTTFVLIVFNFAVIHGQNMSTADENQGDTIYIGPCAWVLSNRKCPDVDVKFYLYTRSNPDDRQFVHIDKTWEETNISTSYYNPRYPVKIIIHGYNADMMLTPLIDAKREYLQRGDYNLFFVDWGVLAPAPCYPSAVHNTRHVGICIAQLITRIRETGNEDIHLVGFSLGAQICNYVATTLRSDNYTIPRITGLDPAMPLFVTTDLDNKLDATDGEFVDVLHTNALVQGQIERCGHVDFYLNGGVIQPGCNGFGINPIQCSHHRAPDYFAESIQSVLGFWGWKCQSYFYYLLGMCTPTSELQALAGEDCRKTTQGMYFITTNAASPFALGRITDSVKSLKTQQLPPQIYLKSIAHFDPFQRGIDVFGKLDGNFNNEMYSTNNGEIDSYFTNHGSNKIAHNFLNRLKHQNVINDDESVEKQLATKQRPNSRQSRSNDDDDDDDIRYNEIVH